MKKREEKRKKDGGEEKHKAKRRKERRDRESERNGVSTTTNIDDEANKKDPIPTSKIKQGHKKVSSSTARLGISVKKEEREWIKQKDEKQSLGKIYTWKGRERNIKKRKKRMMQEGDNGKEDREHNKEYFMFLSLRTPLCHVVQQTC